MDIGFTGTRNGMTAAQKESFKQLMFELMPDHFRQGCCIGADEDSVLIIRTILPICFIVGHPGLFAVLNKNDCHSNIAEEYSSEILPLETHFARNQRICKSMDELIATPWQNQAQEPAENEGGGTWYTIHYALRLHKKVRIIWPNGIIEIRNA